MFYLFNRTTGNVQKYLQPRYNKDSQTCFIFAKKMFTYLASIYINLNTIRDARYEYNVLVMKLS